MTRLVLTGWVRWVFAAIALGCVNPNTTIYKGCPDTEDSEWSTVATVTHVRQVGPSLYGIKLETASGCTLSAFWYTARTPKPGMKLLLKGSSDSTGKVEILDYRVLDDGKLARQYREGLGGGVFSSLEGGPAVSNGFRFPDIGNALETSKVVENHTKYTNSGNFPSALEVAIAV